MNAASVRHLIKACDDGNAVPHAGDCIGTLCDACGCCMHCTDSCGCQIVSTAGARCRGWGCGCEGPA